MAGGGSIFVRRALVFLDAARTGKYPNAPWLAAHEEVSVPTARRVIHRLQDDFGAPLLYSNANRGFELTDPAWSFPADGLTDRRELLAVALAFDVGRAVADEELSEALDTFWLRLAARLDAGRIGLDDLLESFSSDRTDRRMLRDPVVVDAIEAVAQRGIVVFSYASPWKDEPATRRVVKPLHVRCSDGAVYLLALTDNGERVFNLACVHDLEQTGERFELPPGSVDRNWAATFGVWTGEGAADVCIRIGPPGARYYIGQQWHPGQEDRWDGAVLVRRMRAHVSAELVRRLLGLGESLLAVEPETVRTAVLRAARALRRNLEGG